MTVEVNFNTRTGFSYIVIRSPGSADFKMEYVGKQEEPTGKYAIQNESLHKKQAKAVGERVRSRDEYYTAELYDRVVAGVMKDVLKKEEKKVDKRIDAVYGSFWGGVEINGLDEARMIRHWRETDRSSPAFFKGAAFGWPSHRDRTSHSVVARLLAVGLPEGIKKDVSIGVKTNWTAHDVQVYAEAIWSRLKWTAGGVAGSAGSTPSMGAHRGS